MTHFLTGACLGRAGLNRTTALATVTLTLAAEAPDIDVLWYFKGSVVGFAHHRGITHTFLGVPVVAAAVIALVWCVRLLWRKLRPGTAPPHGRFQPPLRWGLLYAYACLAGLSHLLLDFTNNYGLRPFFPFNPRWYAWSTVFIVDPALLLVLVLGLVLPMLFGLISTEVGARQHMPRGRTGAIAALLLVVTLWGIRGFERNRALGAMEALNYREEQPVRVFVSPYMVNPFRWHGIVETRNFYQTVTVDSLRPEVDPDNRARTFYKPAESQASLAAKQSLLGRVYLDWAMFPVIQTEQEQGPQGGYIVRFSDLRFAYPERRDGPLGAYMILDSNLHPLRAAFNSRQPQQAETAQKAP